jgi:VWFA-related protein
MRESRCILQISMRHLAALLALAMAAGAQPPDQLPSISVDVNVVNVLFTVRDRKGALVTTLTKDDITVLEDGKPQQIKTFTRETDLPLTIGLLVDVSRSQQNLIEVERRAAAEFFRHVMRPKDMAFVISFGAEAELLQDLTNSVKLLQRSLDHLRLSVAPVLPPILGPGPVPTSGRPRGTILLDAVYLAATEKLQNEVGRKVIVLISDGGDQGSRITREEALAAAHRADAIIYSIFYVDPSFGRRWGYSGDEGLLKRLSEETGGRVYRVDRKKTLQAIFDELQDEMRSQYALTYSPSNLARDGAFRRIEIRTRNKDLKVQARRGYFAPK